MGEALPKPSFLKRRISLDAIQKMNTFMQEHELNTVCNTSQCPNRGECFENGHATFIILGDTCTRSCSFCAIKTGRPPILDKEEPFRVAEAVEKLGLNHAVITSVARDELPDQGSEIFAETIRQVKLRNPQTTVEVLIPDFRGDLECLKRVCDAGPDVLNHNIETIDRLHKTIRPQAKYQRSLDLHKRVKELYPNMLSKCGFMVGLGESKEEILSMITDIKDAGVDILTIGQYLQPTEKHHKVIRYVEPEEYNDYKKHAQSVGIPHTFAAPFVRSSYMAGDVMAELRTRKGL